jgi:AcrR family transcriptional regulator
MLRAMSESPDPTDARIVAGLWQVVALRGWPGLTLARLVAASGVPAATLRARCPTPGHLLGLHALVVDQAVLAGTVPGQGGTARDRVFDVLMRRIDAMQPHRAGLLRLAEDAQRDPLLALTAAATLPRSMAWMLEAAELSAPCRLVAAARVQALTVVWLATLRAWRQDASGDLGATMAALDRALDRAEQVARSLGLEAPA